MSEPLVTFEDATTLVERVSKLVYNQSLKQCMTCYGRGFYTLNDDDACDVIPCECKL